ncbi:hypothetical protein Q7P37_004416 [Cladosporium fusiforme]
MHLTTVAAAASLLAVSAQAWKPSSTNGTDHLAEKGLLNLEKHQNSSNSTSYCTIKNAAVRKEWLSLSDAEKIAYTDAVQCLMEKPSISGELVPGARSRFDDFVGTHINQTMTIHATGNFLSWHRYFTWTYERALREECGYDGYQPYINWAKYAHDIVGSPLFDGSETSMSGNGEYAPHNGTGIPTNENPTIFLPAGNGSGCVTEGPFKNLTVRLGPVGASLEGLPPNPQADGLGLNERCLRRDLSQTAAATGSTEALVYELIADYTDILSFQNRMQGDFANGFIGVHTAGHYWVRADPGGDFFASPGDPHFWMHHAQIDRTWWIWQNQDPKNRQNAIGGTNTMFDTPPSANTTLDDMIDLGVNAPGMKIRDAMSTLDGPFCYIYA